MKRYLRITIWSVIVAAFAFAIGYRFGSDSLRGINPSSVMVEFTNATDAINAAMNSRGGGRVYLPPTANLDSTIPSAQSPNPSATPPHSP
jgi:hypothetical protein